MGSVHEKRLMLKLGCGNGVLYNAASAKSFETIEWLWRPVALQALLMRPTNFDS
jgi:hypothetical protein